MDVLEVLDAAAVRRWSTAALASVAEHRIEIDELNVFPIPDGDTGTNLVLTLRAADNALGAERPRSKDAATALRAYARGAVLGAHGNSGGILAQLLRGMADAADGTTKYGGAALREGLVRGAEQARVAVADPVEGTILTVAHAAAAALPDGDATLVDIGRAAVVAAHAALRRTTEQLPALARAGVVDAGGWGLVLVLDALSRTIGAAVDIVNGPLAPARPSGRLESARETGSSEYGFEVQYLLDAPQGAVDVLRGELAALGDSLVVVGTGEGLWNVHVHVNDVGAAVEAGVAAGRPHRISVVRFADQIADRLDRPLANAVVAIAPGEGLAHLFEAEGATVVGGSNPSIAEVVAVVRSTGATEVVLLPNASQVTGVAEAAAVEVRADGVRVAVVPTRSPVQGLAALAVHDAGRRFEDDVVAMAEAAAATRFAEVTVAAHESLTSIGICQAGDVLGLIDGDVVEIGHGLVAVSFALVDRLLGVGAELMTILVGADAPAGVGEVIAGHARRRAPLTEVTVYTVGQPRYPLIIGAE